MKQIANRSIKFHFLHILSLYGTKALITLGVGVNKIKVVWHHHILLLTPLRSRSFSGTWHLGQNASKPLENKYFFYNYLLAWSLRKLTTKLQSCWRPLTLHVAIKKLHNNPPPFSNFQVAQLLLKNKLMHKMDLKHRLMKYFKSLMTFNTSNFNYGFSFFILIRVQQQVTFRA